LHSRISNWPNAVFDSMDIFRNEFRCIAIDQRNANFGESTGPIPASEPWDAFTDDQLRLMDYLGIKQFHFIGYCTGGRFAGRLMPAGARPCPRRRLFAKPSAIGPKIQRLCIGVARETGGRTSVSGGPMCRQTRLKNTCTIFMRHSSIFFIVCRATSYGAARSDAGATGWCAVPSAQTSIDVASLAPNAEITVFPWKEPAQPEGPDDQPGAQISAGKSPRCLTCCAWQPYASLGALQVDGEVCANVVNRIRGNKSVEVQQTSAAILPGITIGDWVRQFAGYAAELAARAAPVANIRCWRPRAGLGSSRRCSLTEYRPVRPLLPASPPERSFQPEYLTRQGSLQ
jgi:alpha/beta hydrolase family protein